MDNYHIIFSNSKDKDDFQLRFLKFINFSIPNEYQYFNFIF